MKQSKVTETIRVGALTVCAAAVAFGSVSHADAKPNLADEAGRAEAAQVVQQNMQQQVLDKLQKAYGRSFEGVEMELLKQRSLDPQNLLRFLLTAEGLDNCLLIVMLDAETGAVLDMRLENQLATTDDMVRNKYATVLRNATTGQTLALQSGDFIPQVGQGASRSGGAVNGSRLVPFAPYFPWVAEPRHPLTDTEATSDDTSSADDNTPQYTVPSAPASGVSCPRACSGNGEFLLRPGQQKTDAAGPRIRSAPAVSGGISAGGSFGGASAGGGSYGGGSTASSASSATSPVAPAQPTPEPPAADPTEPENPTDPSDEENESTDTTTPGSDGTETLPEEDSPMTTAAEPTVRAFSARSLKMLGNAAGVDMNNIATYSVTPLAEDGSANEASGDASASGIAVVLGSGTGEAKYTSGETTTVSDSAISITKTGSKETSKIPVGSQFLTVTLDNGLTLMKYGTVEIDFSKVSDLAGKQYIEVKFKAATDSNAEANLTNVTFKGFDGYKQVDGYYKTDADAAAVDGFYSVFFQAPEPTTAVLSLLGLAALTTRRRRPSKA